MAYGEGGVPSPLPPPKRMPWPRNLCVAGFKKGAWPRNLRVVGFKIPTSPVTVRRRITKNN